MEIIDHIEQGSPEWIDLRLGIITCSEMSSIRADGAGACSYINGLAFERLTGESASVFDGNDWTKRGQELEPVARNMYEVKTGLEVSMVSFVKNKGFGYSPDGLIYNSNHLIGAIEIKVKQPYEQMHILRSGEIPKKHLDQLHGGLSCAELDWIDFVSYCPSLPLFIKRIYAKDCKDQMEKIESLIVKYNQMIDEAVNQIADMY
ncbi:MAG: hypothetical protein GAK29_01465 [Acinetobacter bereziniae]|uniref:YqaJ viral recombinase domain-containing protein n=1 Tax=Acinetobacter bereziniae TaxID=106648 RepID=A0A833PDH8_ACIBZ|nr:MAG: hypothetical protein GAK29_01465 [Acinetobacter bereziniae]